MFQRVQQLLLGLLAQSKSSKTSKESVLDRQVYTQGGQSEREREVERWVRPVGQRHRTTSTECPLPPLSLRTRRKKKVPPPKTLNENQNPDGTDPYARELPRERERKREKEKEREKEREGGRGLIYSRGRIIIAKIIRGWGNKIKRGRRRYKER